MRNKNTEMETLQFMASAVMGGKAIRREHKR